MVFFLYTVTMNILDLLETIEYIKFLRSNGISFREMAKEGDTFLLGDTTNYRWISNKNYKNHVTVVYGNKVVLDLGDGDCWRVR